MIRIYQNQVNIATESGMFVAVIFLSVLFTRGSLTFSTDDTQKVKLALEYVHRVQTSKCNGGTEEVLQLTFNNSVWSSYTEPAIRTANLLTDIMVANNGTLNSLSDEILFSMVRNNIHGSNVIFGSAIAIEPGTYKYPSFCPYAFKKNDTVFAHDIAINYNYLDQSTEWYQAVKIRDWDNVTIKTDIIKYRSGNSLLPSVNSMKILARLEDGHWTKPYFDCGGGDIWMVTYSSPIFIWNDTNKALVFQGVATIDIELTNIDINQCDAETGSVGALDIFRGTHSCMPSTKCLFQQGLGFRRGAYRCVCEDGYYFPNYNSGGERSFSGIEIENLYANNDTSTLHNMRCKPCAVGCDTCVDASPCLYTNDLLLRVSVLILTIITVLAIFITSAVTYYYRMEMAIKTGSPIFLQLMCGGSILMCARLFVAYPSSTDILCTVEPWPFHVGFIIMYGALLLKTWRIAVIFRVGKMQRVNLPDKVLLQRLLPLVAICIAYLAAWTASVPSSAEIRVTGGKLKYKLCKEDWWSYGIQGGEAILLLFGVYLCFTVRKAPAHFNESKHITWSTYNAIILGSFLIIVKLFIRESSGPDYVYLLSFFQIQVFVTITITLIFVPKFFALYRNTEVRQMNGDGLPSVTRTITGREKTILPKHSSKNTIATQTSPDDYVTTKQDFLTVHNLFPKFGKSRVQPLSSEHVKPGPS